MKHNATTLKHNATTLLHNKNSLGLWRHNDSTVLAHKAT